MATTTKTTIQVVWLDCDGETTDDDNNNKDTPQEPGEWLTSQGLVTVRAPEYLDDDEESYEVIV